MNTFSHIQNVGEIVEQKIPVIVSSIEKDKAHSESEVREKTSKTISFQNLQEEKKESAYLEQKEETESVTRQNKTTGQLNYCIP